MLQVIVHQEDVRRVKRRTSPDEDDGSEVCACISINNIFLTLFIEINVNMMELQINVE